MTPDYWTLTIEQSTIAFIQPFGRTLKHTRVTEDVYGPPDRNRIIEAATRLDARLLELDGWLFHYRERTCTRGWING